MEEEGVFFLSDGLRIHAVLNVPRPGAPCVIMSHGLNSTGDGDDYPEISLLLAWSGIASLRLNHRGHGPWPYASEGGSAPTTLSGRIADLRAATDFLRATPVDTQRLGGIGTSFGGMVVLGAREPMFKALVLVATPCAIPPLGSSVVIANASLKEDMARYDLLATIRESHAPVLIIHGDSDTTVPVENAYALFDSAREPKGIEVIPGADHVFSQPEHRQHVNELAVQWFKTHLLPGAG